MPPESHDVTWMPQHYHVLTHANTDEVMLGINAVARTGPGATFHRNGQALHWRPDPQADDGCSFADLPPAVWSAIDAGRCFLVEFGPLGPLTEHDVILAPA